MMRFRSRHVFAYIVILFFAYVSAGDNMYRRITAESDKDKDKIDPECKLRHRRHDNYQVYLGHDGEGIKGGNFSVPHKDYDDDELRAQGRRLSMRGGRATSLRRRHCRERSPSIANNLPPAISFLLVCDLIVCVIILIGL